MKSMLKNQINISFKKVRVLIFACLAVLFMSSLSWAADYYVATNGNDGNPGTLSSPWKSISKANASLKAGDTVFIKAGTYYETIKPANSGTSGNYITYARYQNDTVTITDVYYGADLAARNYIVIDGIRFEKPTKMCVNMRNSENLYHHIVIKNCYMYGAGGYANMSIRRVDYCEILKNTFRAYCPSTSSICDDCGGPDGDHLIIWDSSYCLIEGNDFGKVSHVCLTYDDNGRGFTAFNVIRNNTFSNTWHTNISLGFQTDYDEHSFLIEGNKIYNAGTAAATAWCGSATSRSKPFYGHSALQTATLSNSIIRKNDFSKNGHFGTGTGHDIRIYNNTSYQNGRSYSIITDKPAYNTIYKNNISFDSSYEVYRAISGNPRNNFYVNNSFLGGAFVYSPDESGAITLSSLQSKYPAYWHDNIAKNPMFKDAANKDFALQKDSPMINTGAWLTTVTSASGEGISFVVDDAKYFMDGWGIIEGDIIQLQGQSKAIKIVKIDGNTITVDQEISWNNGDGVSLAYSGAKPDIGAHEYESGDTIMLTIPPNQRVILPVTP